MHHRGLGFAVVYLLALAPPASPDERREESKVDFNRDVRPILANNCILCHGPDAKQRKADLRLDLREGATADLGGYWAIVPGKPEKSELVKRITSADRDEVMPPAKTGKKLTAAQIDVLRRWIAEGAPYARHWSFVKPERPAVPAVKDAAWPRNDVDRFILGRLEREGLAPSAEADPYALLRRLSIDLTGLPPTVREADAFAKDSDPRAYEKAVDRLLDSPSYGERWAKVWLDLARYADSQGYAEDRPRVIWPYRDWVIRALNSNMPFDRFTVEQLAGDLLPHPTEDQLHATAFHRNTLTNTEGGTDDEEFRNVAIVDRVNTTLQVWMGITLNCAQCHDHKFDPFTQEEFFRLFAFLNNTEDNDAGDDRPFLALWSDEQKRKKKDLEAEIAQLQATLDRDTPATESGRKRWEAVFSKDFGWKPAGEFEGAEALFRPETKGIAGVKVEGVPGFSLALVPEKLTASPARFVRVSLQGNQKILSLAEVQAFVGEANVAPQGKASQSSVAYDGLAKLANDGNTNGDYFASKSVTHTDTENNPWWEVDLGKMQPVERVVVWNRTDGGQEIMNRLKGFKIRLLDDARKDVEEKLSQAVPSPSFAWHRDGVQELAVRGGTGGVFALAKVTPVPAGAAVRLRPAKKAGKFKVFLTEDLEVGPFVDAPAEIRALLKKSPRAPQEEAKLAAHYRTIAPALAPTRDRMAAAKKELEGMKPAATVPVMRELAKRRKTQIQVRGNFLVRGKEVTEGVPSAFHPLGDLPPNRLGLARWLVHPDNPLSARVLVNRYWEQIFGFGLVATSEDWGVRGDLPSHPELLDWLATEIVGARWDVKRLLRLLVTSATYRQTSQVTPGILGRDPSNRLLARGPRIRLSAESVRDQALFVSGLLSKKMFGPSVYPPQPKMGLNAAFSSSLDWQTSQGEDKYRRGLYTFWRRSITYPSMATFDAPDRNVCTVRRIATNTPLQALVTMNDPVYVEASQALARRMVAEGGPAARERAAFGFRCCLSRPPRPAELDRLVALYGEARERYAKEPAKAKTMATEPLGPAPQGADLADLAAWTVVGNVLLNLDEMVLKR